MKKIKIDIKAIIVIALVLIIILAESNVLSRILNSAGNGKLYMYKWMEIEMLFHIYEGSNQEVFRIIYYVFNYALIALVLLLYFWNKKYSLIPSAILLLEEVLSIFKFFALRFALRYDIAQSAGIPLAQAWNIVKAMFKIPPETYIAIICLVAIIVIIAIGLKNNKPIMTAANGTKADSVEEIMKYKKLCDSGVITQEEYEEKKAKLLE